MANIITPTSKYPVQNWNEFLEMSRFGLPDLRDLNHAGSRITANIEYYSGNYLWILALFCLFALYVPFFSNCIVLQCVDVCALCALMVCVDGVR